MPTANAEGSAFAVGMPQKVAKNKVAPDTKGKEDNDEGAGPSKYIPDRRIGACVKGSTDGGADGWIDGSMDGRVDRSMNLGMDR